MDSNSAFSITQAWTQSILEAERRRLHETHLRTADLRAAMEAYPANQLERTERIKSLA